MTKRRNIMALVLNGVDRVPGEQFMHRYTVPLHAPMHVNAVEVVAAWVPGLQRAPTPYIQVVLDGFIPEHCSAGSVDAIMGAPLVVDQDKSWWKPLVPVTMVKESDNGPAIDRVTVTITKASGVLVSPTPAEGIVEAMKILDEDNLLLEMGPGFVAYAGDVIRVKSTGSSFIDRPTGHTVTSVGENGIVINTPMTQTTGGRWVSDASALEDISSFRGVATNVSLQPCVFLRPVLNR